MAIIEARSGRAIVSVRRPGKRQRCIAFSAGVSRKALPESVTHIGIGYEPADKSLTFFPVASEMFRGDRAHKVVRDGGANATGRAVYINARAIPEKMFPSGRYVVKLGRAGRFSISAGKVKS